MKDRIARYQEGSHFSSMGVSQPLIWSGGEVLVELKDVSVSYHERKVSISGFVLLVVGQIFFRCCETRTGRYEQVKGGISRGQTVCYQQLYVRSFLE